MDIMPANTKSDFTGENPTAGPAQNHQQTYQSPGGQINIAQAMERANQQAKETGIYPEFSIKVVQNNFKTLQEGRPIFDEIEWVKIRVAGDRNNVVEHKVGEADKHRFAPYYEAFRAGEKVSESGTPVEHWPMISRSQAATLKHLNIFTVEALAELSDQGMNNIGMGGREMVNKAQAFLEAASATAMPQHLAVENERLKNQMEDLQRQMHEIGQATAGYKDMEAEKKELETTVTNLEGKVAQLQLDNAALQSTKATKKPAPKRKPAPKAKESPKPTSE